MTTLTERLRTEGRHAGVEGMLRKQVELKNGPIPQWADNRISQANDDQLEQWVTSIFSADTIEDLLGERD